MKVLLLCIQVDVKSLNLEILRCHLADYVKNCTYVRLFALFNQSGHSFLAMSLSLPLCLLKSLMQTLIALLIKYADFRRNSSLRCCHCESSLFKIETVWSGFFHLTKQELFPLCCLLVCFFINRISGNILPMEIRQMAALSQQNHVRRGDQRILQ